MSWSEIKSGQITVWTDPSSSWAWVLYLNYTYQTDDEAGLVKLNTTDFTFYKGAHTTDYVSTSSDSVYGVRLYDNEQTLTFKFNNQNKREYVVPFEHEFIYHCEDDGTVNIPLYLKANVSTTSTHVPKLDWFEYILELPKLNYNSSPPIYVKTTKWVKNPTIYVKGDVWVKQ